MDDGEVGHQANFDVMRFQVPDRYRNRRLLQKTGAIDQRFVRIGAIKILSEDFIETLYVGILDGADVIAVEAGQFGNVVSHGFSSADLFSSCDIQSSNIGGGTKPPNSRSINSANFSGVRSSSHGPTICTPTGKPS